MSFAIFNWEWIDQFSAWLMIRSDFQHVSIIGKFFFVPIADKINY